MNASISIKDSSGTQSLAVAGTFPRDRRETMSQAIKTADKATG